MTERGAGMSTAVTNGPKFKRVMRTCVKTLRDMAAYKFGRAFRKRLRELAENKDSLTKAERVELSYLVDFWQKRTLEKLRAQVALKYLDEILPDLVSSK
jgi:hypothetical protein